MRSSAGLLIPLALIGGLARAANHDVELASVAAASEKPWQWTVFVKAKADALHHVRCVQYSLDPSFPNPSRTICAQIAPDQPFATSGIAWGAFNVSAQITFDDNTVVQRRFTINPPGLTGTERLVREGLSKAQAVPPFSRYSLLRSYKVDSDADSEDLALNGDGTRLVLWTPKVLWSWGKQTSEKPERFRQQGYFRRLSFSATNILIDEHGGMFDLDAGKWIGAFTDVIAQTACRNRPVIAALSQMGLRVVESGTKILYSGAWKPPNLDQELPEAVRAKVRPTPSPDTMMALSADARYLALVESPSAELETDNKKFVRTYKLPTFIQILELASGKYVSEFRVDITAYGRPAASAVSFSENGRLLAVGGSNSLQVYDWRNQRLAGVIPEEGSSRDANSTEHRDYDYDSQQKAAYLIEKLGFFGIDKYLGVCLQGRFDIWNLEDKRRISKVDGFGACAFSADGARVALVGPRDKSQITINVFSVLVE